MPIYQDSRNKIHETALQIMYSFLIMERLNLEIDFIDTLENITGADYPEIDIFLKEILLKSLKYQSEAVSICEEKLNNWKFKRLNLCIQAIFILSFVHYKYMEDVDKAVIINIAVKLAKKYGDSTDYKYVNAVLDKALDD